MPLYLQFQRVFVQDYSNGIYRNLKQNVYVLAYYATVQGRLKPSPRLPPPHLQHNRKAQHTYSSSQSQCQWCSRPRCPRFRVLRRRSRLSASSGRAILTLRTRTFGCRSRRATRHRRRTRGPIIRALDSTYCGRHIPIPTVCMQILLYIRWQIQKPAW